MVVGLEGIRRREGERRSKLKGNARRSERARRGGIPSVRLELAGFGEYGSFVVPAEGPRGDRRPPLAWRRSERNETDYYY